VEKGADAVSDWREWIGFVLVILGIARAALLIAHDPIIGYANQADMHRTGSCIGLYPAIDEPARSEATPLAPIASYRSEAARRGNCYASTEVLIDAAVVATARALQIDGGSIRLQWLGYAKLFLSWGATKRRQIKFLNDLSFRLAALRQLFCSAFGASNF